MEGILICCVYRPQAHPNVATTSSSSRLHSLPSSPPSCFPSMTSIVLSPTDGASPSQPSDSFSTSILLRSFHLRIERNLPNPAHSKPSAPQSRCRRRSPIPQLRRRTAARSTGAHCSGLGAIPPSRAPGDSLSGGGGSDTGTTAVDTPSMPWAFLRGIKRRGVSLSALFGLGRNDNKGGEKDFSYNNGARGVKSSSSGNDSRGSCRGGGGKGGNETGDGPLFPHGKDDPRVNTSGPGIAGRKGGGDRRDPLPRPALAVIELGEVAFEVSDCGSEPIFCFFSLSVN